MMAAGAPGGAGVLGLLLPRFAGAPPPVRRRLGPALLAALLLAVALAGEQGWIGPVAPAADAVYVGVAACLLFGLLRTRLTGTRMRQLVVGLDRQPVELPVGSARATATVLGNEDEPLAVLVHDPALLDDAGLVDAVAAAARLALENERLQAQIRLRVEDVIASRARIGAASDAERRRIERDLHAGAQQQLVSLAL